MALCYGGPIFPPPYACTECGLPAWIFKPHAVTRKSVCLECAKKAPDGFVACPGDHKKPCPLCRATPGFMEELV